ncbi:MAG TPA: PqqD family protein [Caulobacteraceae bacterium]|jgi:hypothetical protein|nr:PqqD family protein [Caulobacteraceae bacterium]
MYVRKDGWLAAQVGDELVMMSADSGAYLGLNEVGARVWAIIETPAALPEICAALAREFETTPEACRQDVETFLGELSKRGAVVTG